MSGYVQVSKPNNGRQHGCIQDTKEETEERRRNYMICIVMRKRQKLQENYFRFQVRNIKCTKYHTNSHHPFNLCAKNIQKYLN